MNGKAMMAGTTTPLIPSGAELVSAHKSKGDATKSYRYGSFFHFLQWFVRTCLFLHVDMPMERKTPIAYPDGVYEIAGGDRGNVMLIANITQHGLTGLGSTRRTALFTFFGNSGNRYSSLC